MRSTYPDYLIHFGLVVLKMLSEEDKLRNSSPCKQISES